MKVHVTLFPDPIEVPDDEVEVLRAQGILREDAPAPAEQAAAKPAVTQKGDKS
jgi:hypothetical protein